MKVSFRGLSIVVALVATVSAAQAGPKAGDGDKPHAQFFSAIHKDHFDEAERLALKANSRLLAKYARWVDYTSSHPKGAFSEITRFIEANPDWPLMTQMQRRAEESITAATPNSEILEWFSRHEPVSADGGIAYARALMAAGKTDKAVQLIRKTWVETGFGILQERQFLSLFSDNLRAEDHWRRLDRLLWDKQEGPAQRMLSRVGPGHRAVAQARLALQDGNSNADTAIRQVPAELRDDPGLVYDRVRWRRQKEMDDEAIDLLSHPARNKVRPDLWWQERSILARRLLQKGRVSQAYQVASDHGLAEGTSQLADAEFMAGWIALRFLRDTETGAMHFQRLFESVSSPMSRSRAAYWSGRAAEAMGDGKGAREWFTKGAGHVTTYYGQLAAARLDRHHWPLPSDPKPTPEDLRRFEDREVTKVTRLLMNSGETQPLRAFFIRLNDLARTPGERALVAKLAEEGGRRDLGVVVARRADRDGVTLVEAGWPLPNVTVESNAEKALVLALIRQESNFHKEAVSTAGARGWMQLLPSTAEKVAKSIKLAFTPKKLDDPNFNVRLGSVYLDGLVSEFEGSYILALAAYNAGPARARRWIKELGDPRDPEVDVVDWIESIPFSETRNYVQRVMESVEVYRRRLGRSKDGGLESDLKRWARRGAA